MRRPLPRALVGRTCARRACTPPRSPSGEGCVTPASWPVSRPGAKVGRPSAEQSEIARLRRQLELAQRRLSRTEAALDIMGKAHALLEEISESAPDQPTPKKR
jgi:hypothetical protein